MGWENRAPHRPQQWDPEGVLGPQNLQSNVGNSLENAGVIQPGDSRRTRSDENASVGRVRERKVPHGGRQAGKRSSS